MNIEQLLEYEPQKGTKVDIEIYKYISKLGFSLIRLRPNGKQADREKQWQQYCQTYREFDQIPIQLNENMGIAIGPASDVVCIDVDDINAFVDWAFKNNITSIDTRIHASVKGFHIFYKRWDNLNKNNRLSLRTIGVDVMINKSQVVSPGSIVMNGNCRWAYTIVNDIIPSPAPDWVKKLVNPKKQANLYLDSKLLEYKNNRPIEGERNVVLFKTICKARDAGATKDELTEFADQYSMITGLPYNEAIRTIESSLTRKYNVIQELKNNKPDDLIDLDFEGMLNGEVGESQIAKIIADFWYDKYRFCVSNKMWYNNIDNIWVEMGNTISPDPLKVILNFLSNFLDIVDLKKDVIRLYKTYQSYNKYVHLIGFLKNNSSLCISENDFDNNYMTLPLKNAVIEFKTDHIIVREIKWTDYIRKTINLEWIYDYGEFYKDDLINIMDSDSNEFDLMLNNIFHVNKECKNILIRLLGYALSGTNNRIKVLPILIGSGNNGKSVLFRCLQSSFEPLVITVTKNLVLNKTDNEDRPKPEMLVLQGTRIGLIGESDDNDYINESTVKALTGGDIRIARNLYSKEMIQIKPTYTLFLATNHEPRIPSGGRALWDRILPIPFKMKFVDQVKYEDELLIDNTIWDWVSKPHLGILVYLLIGWLDYNINGLGEIPDSIINYKKEYKDEEDQYSDFRDQCLTETFDENDFITYRVLCRTYRNWCNDNQIPINTRISDRSIKRGIINSLREWRIVDKIFKEDNRTVRGILNIKFKSGIIGSYAFARPIR